jgi:sec-independent protein translocase protein TatA
MRVGITELLVILAIVLLMFGSKKLPELADGMGKAIRNFKRGINAEDEEDVTPTTPADKQVAASSSAHTAQTAQTSQTSKDVPRANEAHAEHKG